MLEKIQTNEGFITKIRSSYGQIKAKFHELVMQGGSKVGPLKRLQAIFRTLMTDHSKPLPLAAAVTLGIVIGCTPFFGLHLLLCILFAYVLRLNMFITYLAANISIPPLAPFLAVGSIQIGHYLFYGRFLEFSFTSLEEIRTRFFLYWLVGSGVLGGGLGLVAGSLVYFAARFRRGGSPGHKGELSDEIDSLFRAAQPFGKFRAHFIKGKLKHDPVYKIIMQKIPMSCSFTDLGGGYGILACLYALKSVVSSATVRVVDWDGRKIEFGRQLAKSLNRNVDYVVADIFSDLNTDNSDTSEICALIDVLHYQPVSRQTSYLTQLGQRIRAGGYLLIGKVRPLLTNFGSRASQTILLSHSILRTIAIPFCSRTISRVPSMSSSCARLES
jgi:uncharacterized protein (DUF2062 family)/2-polyprenyl-3-methyl-5-hydroxy-6-metoxy-1,4-benzoquinol methylase